MLHTSILILFHNLLVDGKKDLLNLEVLLKCSDREPLKYVIYGLFTCYLVLFLDVITCLSLDDDGHHLITGSRDTTCRLWGITHQGGVAQELIRTPLQTLYGHDKPITCVAMSWELDMVASGSEVGFYANCQEEIWTFDFAGKNA